MTQYALARDQTSLLTLTLKDSPRERSVPSPFSFTPEIGIIANAIRGPELVNTVANERKLPDLSWFYIDALEHLTAKLASSQTSPTA
jgi:hypothetical protein